MKQIYKIYKEVNCSMPFQPTSRPLCCWEICFRQPTTAVKLLIKSSLFVQKFKGAGQGETEDWLCL